MCEQKYFMNYVLGLPDKQNKKACMGSVTHKNFEVLARIKLLKDQNKRVYEDEELGKIKSNIPIDELNERSFNYYDGLYPNLMDPNAIGICLDWTNKGLEYQGGKLDPRNQNVESVEEFFDITIEEEWAKYSYTIGDQQFDGHLAIRGTVDLIFREDEAYYHIQDLKTGRRYDWASETIKTYEKLAKDKQLRLYYYAFRKKYPDRRFFVSIYYINDHRFDGKLVEGGLFTFAFDDIDFTEAEQDIKKIFAEVKNNDRPALLSNTCSNFKCKYMCAYSQIIPEIDERMPACLAIRDQIQSLGIDKVTEKYGDLKKLSVYTGGGKTNMEIK